MAKVTTNQDNQQPFKNGIVSKKAPLQPTTLEVLYLACTKDAPNVGTFTSHLAIVLYYCPVERGIRYYQSIVRLFYNGVDISPLMISPYEVEYNHMVLTTEQIFTYHRAINTANVDASKVIEGFNIKPLKKAPVRLFHNQVTTHVDYSGICPDKITFKYLAIEVNEWDGCTYYYNYPLEVYVNDQDVFFSMEPHTVSSVFAKFIRRRFYIAFEIDNPKECTPEAVADAISAAEWEKYRKEGGDK